MCGRFARIFEKRQLMGLLEEAFGAVQDAAAGDDFSYNIRPGQTVLTVVEREAPCCLTSTTWGLVPFWSKGSDNRIINARQESLAAKPAFRSLVNRRRCLIPADGFYEWGLCREQACKVPYYFSRRDGVPLFFAGLWDNWIDSRSEEMQASCTIITTAANGLMRPIHDRMPVIVEGAGLRAWLDVENVRFDDLRGQLKPMASDVLECREVSDAVSHGLDSPECIAPAKPRPVQGMLF